MPEIQDFAAEYWLVDGVEVATYSGKRVIMHDEVFFELVGATGRDPLIGRAGRSHFELHPDGSIPSYLVAVPGDMAGVHDGDGLLLSKSYAGYL